MENLNQSNLSDESIFKEEWRKLANTLFAVKINITQDEIKEIMKKYNFDSNKENDQKINVFDTKFTLENIINAFENKKSITLDELYNGLKKSLDDKSNFRDEWRKLANTLFAVKVNITKNEIKEIMKKYNFDSNKENDQKFNVFDTKFTWENILNAFKNKKNMTIDEFYNELKKSFGNENNFNKQWMNLINKLFSIKSIITKNEIKKIMKKYNFDSNKENDQKFNVFDTKFTWENILNAFKNKKNMTIDEFYNELKKLF